MGAIRTLCLLRSFDRTTDHGEALGPTRSVDREGRVEQIAGGRPCKQEQRTTAPSKADRCVTTFRRCAQTLGQGTRSIPGLVIERHATPPRSGRRSRSSKQSRIPLQHRSRVHRKIQAREGWLCNEVAPRGRVRKQWHERGKRTALVKHLEEHARPVSRKAPGGPARFARPTASRAHRSCDSPHERLRFLGDREAERRTGREARHTQNAQRDIYEGVRHVSQNARV